jgi:plasmid replication initiation protein
MDLGKLNLLHLQNSVDSLLSKVVGVTLESGGFRRFQLFKRTDFSQDSDGNWYIEIDAHDDALPLMFEFKERYFTYELWNALSLKSSNQLRMYEVLKQYEKIGTRVIPLDDLKELLGISKKDYPRYGNFKIRVLDKCQEALGMYTDIKFTYETTGKKGRGLKTKAIKFTISHNEKYLSPISLDKFLDMGSVKSEFDNVVDANFTETAQHEKSKTIYTEFTTERLAFLAGACENEFDEAEMQIFNSLLSVIMPYAKDPAFAEGNKYDYEIKLYDYLKLKYDELNLQASRREIKSRFGYLKKILVSELAESQ